MPLNKRGPGNSCPGCGGMTVRTNWRPSRRRPLLDKTNGVPRFSVDHRARPPIGEALPMPQHVSLRSAFREALRWDPCAYCGRLPRIRPGTVDHIIATGRGGWDVPFNWTGACEHCNKGKAAEDLLLYMLSRVGGTVPPFHATPAALKRAAEIREKRLRDRATDEGEGRRDVPRAGREARRARARAESRPEIPFEGIPGWAGPGD